jgi:hypothetical protein
MLMVRRCLARWPLGFASKSFDKVHLEGKGLCRFVEYMKQLGDQKGITDPVLVLEQKAGQLVHVQPGSRAHQVTNRHASQCEGFLGPL